MNFATGETSTDDAFGHGTHIAGIIAGSVSSSPTPLYKNGVAPGAHLSTSACSTVKGVGFTSDVIAGIQWVVANRAKYSIRVMNLSLGHPIQQPCAFDPLCLAAETRRCQRPGRRGVGRQRRQGRRRTAPCSAASRRPATRRA